LKQLPADQADARLQQFIQLFFQELNNQNALVRQAAQHCIGVISELNGKTPYELLYPHRERHLANLYTKPLRALNYTTQIGVIEAIRYCLCLSPPLPEMGEELIRLLGETLALAGADDNATPMGRALSRQNAQDIVKLKVACIRLLNVVIPTPKFFSQAQERSV
jgi:transformation/transcription domain-associated protein